MKKHILATRVGRYAYNSVRVLSKGLSISVSEYLRNLILQDLESRRLFEDELAKVVDDSGIDVVRVNFDRTEKCNSGSSENVPLSYEITSKGGEFG